MAFLLFSPFIAIGLVVGYRLITGRADDEIRERIKYNVR